MYSFWFFVFLMVARLFYLQIETGGFFSQKGERNFLRVEVIPPLRGDVFDCNHILLAANRPLFDLYWEGGGGVGLSQEDKEMLQKVSEIVGIDFNESEQRRLIEYSHRFARKMLLKKELTFDELCKISEQCSRSNHLLVANRFKRVYPFKTMACHILGYLGRDANQGLAGVESIFQDELAGRAGFITHVVNATGKKLTQKAYQDATAGVDVILTLDLSLQQLTEQLFEGDFSGAVIIMDPSDGAIRALACNPTYDPNLFLEKLTEEEWSDLLANNPFLNRATCALYPPASIFKLVTFAAGYEEGIIDPDLLVNCHGYVTFCGHKHACMQKHGPLNARQAIAHSCNVRCFHTAMRMSIDTLADYARRFGLGSKTGCLLPEKPGLVPDSVWKRKEKGERWWKGENLSASIGQSYLLVTPLQVARAVSAIFTRQLVRPRILEREDIQKEPLRVAPKTLNFLKQGMKEAVTKGTCWRLGRHTDFDLYAKTGTAQTCSKNLEKSTKTRKEHAWLACSFAFKNEAPLTLVILLEHAESSMFALEMAHKFFNGYQRLRQTGTSQEITSQPENKPEEQHA
jgi:penicillin-binding protein 2